jgi:hypothetical protein
MIDYKHNGEHWYRDSKPLWVRARKWVAWFGGWEEANTGRIQWELVKRWIDWVRDGMPEERAGWGPTPVSLFGHRVTIQPFGVSFSTDRGHLCFYRGQGVAASRGWYVYLSPDATPSSATRWYHNPPAEVLRAVEEHERKAAEKEARWQAELAETKARAEREQAARELADRAAGGTSYDA